MPITRRHAVAIALLLALPRLSSRAQGVDLTVDHVGLAIGDIPRVTGLRLNFRDRNLEWVNGVNVTIWSPYGEGSGTVRGLALGLPLTGAADIDGVATGLFGVGAANRIRGLGVAPIGVGAGGRLEGIMVGGLGVGSGGGITGIGIGGLGVGSGGALRGIFVGGLGVGGGSSVDGIAIGGLGVGIGGRLRGVAIGGLGVGGGGDIEGIAIGGLGVGSGGNVTGIAIGGAGVGAGGRFHGLGIGGLGVGAPRLDGIAISAFAVGAQHATGALIAPWVKIEHGQLRGVAVGGFNQVRGLHHGLAIGIVNYADELEGLQLGLINVARNNPSGAKVLPVVNAHF
jgi:hypothetical protein